MKSKSSNQNGRKWLNRNVAAMGFTSLFSDVSHEMATSILAQFLIVELHGSAEILGLIEGLADFSSSFIKAYSYPYLPLHLTSFKYYFIEQSDGLEEA